MANTAPTSSIYAGDSLTWTASVAKYPATSYRLRCVFSRPGEEPVSIDGTANGSDHDFSLDPADSAGMAAGEWTWAYRATKLNGNESAIAGRGCTLIEPDPAAESREETYNERCLRLVKAALEGRATDVQESFSLLGQDITKTGAETLLALKDHYQSLVNAERRAERARRTGRRHQQPRFILK